MVKIVGPTLLAEVVPAAETENNQNIRKKAVTLAILAGLATAAFCGQRYGLNNELPSYGTEVADSFAHPVLGYVGAWAALSLTRTFRKAQAIAGATAFNFATEKAQSLLLSSPGYGDFLSQQNVPETLKDYAFALGGSALFLLQNRKNNSA